MQSPWITQLSSERQPPYTTTVVHVVLFCRALSAAADIHPSLHLTWRFKACSSLLRAMAVAYDARNNSYLVAAEARGRLFNLRVPGKRLTKKNVSG